MFLGIDLGTSGLKAIVLDRTQRVLASATAPLAVQQPQPLWREQAPRDWWHACEAALDGVLAQVDPQRIEAVGLSGQMHGATLLDARGEVLRPAILWNDGRAWRECAELEAAVPASREITGNLMMPGFTAPKLAWVRRHEPAVFERIARVVLPKDWLRWRLTGEFASDLSDAAGMLWLDVGRRDWSDDLLAATGLSRAQMPSLHEGPEVTGLLQAEVARRFGLRRIPVVAGGGDNAAGAVGVGVVRAGQAMLSLGTSGVCFAATSGFLHNPAQAVHSFCHALPGTWHLMSVMLSAAACLDFTARLTGAELPVLLAEAEARGLSDATPLFLPYLNGERTPHNNPAAQGVFFGLTAATDRADLFNATLEGVGHGLAQGMAALEAAGADLDHGLSLIGGGSRSAYWAQMLADISGKTLMRRAGGDVGPSLGAARLAWMGCDGAQAQDVCPEPALITAHAPQAARQGWMRERATRFAALYRSVAPCFPAAA